MITQEQINNIVQKIVANYQPDKIFLVGSYANGTSTENSDLDLIVVKDTDLPTHKRAIPIHQFLIGSQIQMDILVYTQNEIDKYKNIKYTFLYEALKDVKILYEKR